MRRSIHAAAYETSRLGFEAVAYEAEAGVLLTAIQKDVSFFCTYNIVSTVLSEARSEVCMASAFGRYTRHGGSHFGVGWALWNFGVFTFSVPVPQGDNLRVRGSWR